MARYVQSQRAVIKEYEKVGHIPYLIREIITKRPNYLPMDVKLVKPVKAKNKVDTAREIAESFTQSCYDNMSKDSKRVQAYKSWINSEYQPNMYYLEIGPGANACLALLLLVPHPKAHYVGIEINKDALHGARRTLKDYENAKVFQGFVGSCPLPTQTDCIIQELFGVIASAEGLFNVIETLSLRYPEAVMIPSYAETRMVPLDISIDNIILDPTLTVAQKIFRAKIPFGDAHALSSSAILETLDMVGGLAEHQRHHTELRFSRSGKLTCIGLYIIVRHGDIYITSRADDNDNYASNWANVGVALDSPIDVTQHSVLQMTSVVDLRRMIYTISLRYKDYCETWTINTADLFGDYRYLHTVV